MDHPGLPGAGVAQAPVAPGNAVLDPIDRTASQQEAAVLLEVDDAIRAVRLYGENVARAVIEGRASVPTAAPVGDEDEFVEVSENEKRQEEVSE